MHLNYVMGEGDSQKKRQKKLLKIFQEVKK